MDIEFKDGVVCFASEVFWLAAEKHEGCLVDCYGSVARAEYVINLKDFQLNTIKQGDYIEASELDSQKYNDAVEVFELFGFNPYERKAKDALRLVNEIFFASDDLLFIGAPEGCAEAERKLTYQQLMAIGKLKRLEIERDKQSQVDILNMQSIEPRKQEVKMQKNKPVVAQVMIDLTERMEMGIKTYGEALRANNGRDALQDAYEEALDLACYLKQAMIERDNKEAE